MSTARKYRLMRSTLVVLQRVALRYSINIDNAFESAKKDSGA